MVDKTEFGEDSKEAETPLPIVSGIELENHGNMGLDVDQLDLRCRSRSSDD
jgi:hypothetical protein